MLIAALATDGMGVVFASSELTEVRAPNEDLEETTVLSAVFRHEAEVAVARD